MATQAKIDHVAELVEKIKKAQSVVLVDYQGISVNDETALRRKMREAGAEYLVTKNRLFKIALKEAGVAEVFTPGTPTTDVIEFIKAHVKEA